MFTWSRRPMITFQNILFLVVLIVFCGIYCWPQKPFSCTSWNATEPHGILPIKLITKHITVVPEKPNKRFLSTQQTVLELLTIKSKVCRSTTSKLICIHKLKCMDRLKNICSLTRGKSTAVFNCQHSSTYASTLRIITLARSCHWNNVCCKATTISDCLEYS